MKSEGSELHDGDVNHMVRYGRGDCLRLVNLYSAEATFGRGSQATCFLIGHHPTAQLYAFEKALLLAPSSATAIKCWTSRDLLVCTSFIK